MSYGVTENGFVKKPYEIIVEELNAKYMEIFGNSINLAPESPQGQLVAITAEAIYDTWEMAEAIYGSYNIDDVNGRLLDSRARLRNAVRLEGEGDTEFRVRIQEQLPNNVLKLKDELHDNLLRLDGVKDVVLKYAQGVTKVFIVGGDDTEVATTILDYMPPGALGGNISIPIDKRCNGVKFFRPIFRPVKVFVEVTHFAHLECYCNILDVEKIKQAILDESCGVGYGEYLHKDYIGNLLAQFRGLKIVQIKLNASIENSMCTDDLNFGVDLETVEVKEFEKVLICPENIIVVDSLNKPTQQQVVGVEDFSSLISMGSQKNTTRIFNGV